MESIIINGAGIALIAAIVWWFWLYQPKQEAIGGNDLEILVENGIYTPSHVIVPAHKAFTMNFLRKDPSHCADQVLFPDLEISSTLTLNQAQQINLPALEPGRYAFHCQMQMYRGQIEVT
ncbi:MAG: cupredoxin domain-containing protein [Arenicellales bacterium]